MKRYVPSCLLILLLPMCLFVGAAAQDSGAGDRAGSTAVEKQDSGSAGGSADADAGDSGGGEATTYGEKSVTPEAETGTAAGEPVKRTERRKKVEEKKKEPARQEETAENEVDRESNDGLLLVDHERIRYNRIPGITVSKEEPGEDIVKIPDDKISGDSKEKDEGGGIFGKKTRTIAGWGIVVLIFILFVIYSKTRSRHSRRRVVRTITKR